MQRAKGFELLYCVYMKQQRVVTKFASEKAYLEKWHKMYPESELLILQNTEELEKFFESFEDYTPVTKQEYEEAQKAQKLYKELMQK